MSTVTSPETSFTQTSGEIDMVTFSHILETLSSGDGLSTKGDTQPAPSEFPCIEAAGT